MTVFRVVVTQIGEQIPAGLDRLVKNLQVLHRIVQMLKHLVGDKEVAPG